MSKTLNASCTAGVVQVGSVPIVADILSEGVGSSEGIAVLDENKAFYLAKITPDLKQTLERLMEVLEQVKNGLDSAANALTTLDTNGFLIGATGAVPSPPVAASDISQITAASGQVEAISSQIQALSESLR